MKKKIIIDFINKNIFYILSLLGKRFLNLNSKNKKYVLCKREIRELEDLRDLFNELNIVPKFDEERNIEFDIKESYEKKLIKDILFNFEEEIFQLLNNLDRE